PLRIARPGRALQTRAIPEVEIADTVGAGDSFAAGLFAGLLRTGVTTREELQALPDDDLLELVDDAALVAALNCTRVGADPPTAGELARARAARGH
ncbi:MAG: fructokinase, partial [Thermoleophilaceae bacterium]|nr:fructokinase [Thermoleophilaceae bacterium]